MSKEVRPFIYHFLIIYWLESWVLILFLSRASISSSGSLSMAKSKECQVSSSSELNFLSRFTSLWVSNRRWLLFERIEYESRSLFSVVNLLKALPSMLDMNKCSGSKPYSFLSWLYSLWVILYRILFFERLLGLLG